MLSSKDAEVLVISAVSSLKAPEFTAAVLKKDEHPDDIDDSELSSPVEPPSDEFPLSESFSDGTSSLLEVSSDVADYADASGYRTPPTKVALVDLRKNVTPENLDKIFKCFEANLASANKRDARYLNYTDKVTPVVKTDSSLKDKDEHEHKDKKSRIVTPEKVQTTTPSKTDLPLQTKYMIVTFLEDLLGKSSFQNLIEQYKKNPDAEAIKIRSMLFYAATIRTKTTSSTEAHTKLQVNILDKIKSIPAFEEAKISIGPITITLEDIEDKLPRDKVKGQNQVMNGVSAKIFEAVFNAIKAIKDDPKLKDLTNADLRELAKTIKLKLNNNQWLHVLGYEVGAGVQDTQVVGNLVSNSSTMNDHTKNAEELIAYLLKNKILKEVTFFIETELEVNPAPNPFFKGKYLPIAKSIDHYVKLERGFLHFHVAAEVNQPRVSAARQAALAIAIPYSRGTEKSVVHTPAPAAAPSSSLFVGTILSTSSVDDPSDYSEPSSDGTAPLSDTSVIMPKRKPTSRVLFSDDDDPSADLSGIELFDTPGVADRVSSLMRKRR